MPGMNWTPEADQKLFLSIIVDAAIKPDFEAVAKRLSVGDTVCTTRAVQERLKKLKKQAIDDGWSKAGNGISDADGGAVKSTGPKTPRKKKAEGDADGESPTKKRKTAGAKPTKTPSRSKSSSVVKDEEVEDEEVQDEETYEDGIVDEET